MNIDPTIPYFEDKDTPVQSDKPTVERKTVNVIIYDPKEDKILCIDRSMYGWKTIIVGGIDENESFEDAAKREATEETGYCDLRYVGEAGRFYASFYASNKGVNRLADTTIVLLELISDKQIPIDENDQKDHTPVWIPRGEVLQFVNIESQLHAIQEALKIINKN